MTRTGFNQHVNDRIRMAKLELAKLKRFKNLTPKIKAHLYKALVRSVLEYPTMPLCGISKTNIMRLQSLQNRAIRFITWNDTEELCIKRSHEKYKTDAYNIRLKQRGQKIWEKLCICEPELTDRSRDENENMDLQDHYWRRIASDIENDIPDPIYVYN